MHSAQRFLIDNSLMNRDPLLVSGGQIRSVSIAAVSIETPHFLLLDEPTAGLDKIARQSFYSGVNDLVENGSTTIIVTHDYAEVSIIADRVIEMADGHIVFDGATADWRSYRQNANSNDQLRYEDVIAEAPEAPNWIGLMPNCIDARVRMLSALGLMIAVLFTDKLILVTMIIIGCSAVLFLSSIARKKRSG